MSDVLGIVRERGLADVRDHIYVRDLVRNLDLACDRAGDVIHGLERDLGRYIAQHLARDLALDFTHDLTGALGRARYLACALDRVRDLEDARTRARELDAELDRARERTRALARSLGRNLAGARARTRSLALVLDRIRDLDRVLHRARTAAGRLATAIEKGRHGHATAKGMVPAAFAVRLAHSAVRVLPPDARARYDDEFGSELYELAEAGATRWAQLAYATRLLDRAWVLRAELREAATRRMRS